MSFNIPSLLNHFYNIAQNNLFQHYLLINKPQPPFVSETGSVRFPRQYMSGKQPIPTRCRVGSVDANDYKSLTLSLMITSDIKYILFKFLWIKTFSNYVKNLVFLSTIKKLPMYLESALVFIRLLSPMKSWNDLNFGIFSFKELIPRFN